VSGDVPARGRTDAPTVPLLGRLPAGRRDRTVPRTAPIRLPARQRGTPARRAGGPPGPRRQSRAGDGTAAGHPL